METIDNNEYDSGKSQDTELSKTFKGPVTRRILDSSDDDLPGNSSYLDFENDPVIKEVSISKKNEITNELITLGEGTKNIYKIKKNNLFKRSVLDDSDHSDNNEEPDVNNCSNLIITQVTTTFEKDDQSLSSCMNNQMRFLDNNIYDAEGSSDEGQNVTSGIVADENSGISQKRKKEKKDKTKRNNLQRKSKQTAIEEIRSETQRLIRQSRVSLPYHHPKQRSLSDFLNRRKSLPVVPLKTSSDELSKVWEKIEEREKTAESFYKSDSDVSDDETATIPVNKVPDDQNKATLDNIVNQGSSLNFHLHYTESETQGFQEKTGTVILDRIENNPEVDIERMELIIKAKDHKEIMAKKQSVNDVGCLNVNECNETEVTSTDSNFGATLKENDISNNTLIILNQSSKIATNNDLSDPSNSSERILKNSIDDRGSTEHEIEGLVNNMQKNESSTYLNKSSRLHQDILMDEKFKKAPKLIGPPNGVIDLEKSPNKPGAVKLISRFMKHITLKPKIKVQENVIVAISEVNENGEIVNLKEETLKIKRKEEILKLDVRDNSKPGETRMKLKATLQHKIALSREQQFAKRMEEFKLIEEEIYEGKPNYEEECEEELTATESESEDSEIEDDVLVKDTIKEKNPFVDEEAEESENDEETLENDAGSDSSEYCDPPSVDVGSLVDKDEELPNFDIGIGNSQRNSELMALCSGDFTTQAVNLNELEKNDATLSIFESSGKLVSQIDVSKQEDESREDTCEDSDEEVTVKKKKKPKLVFSDDEDNEIPNILHESEDSKEENQEEEDLESDNEKDELPCENEEELFEEEEYRDISKKAAKHFLEAEAELSGSEWGSADEDEIDLDCMEKEEGDEDAINQKKVRSELEKIHMKEMLDEDKREIRALQELFLEDGELHSDGPKRQRQFRWYNQDGDNENVPFLCNIDGEFKDDEEVEEDESWRKTRLERENFLRNHKTEGLEITNEDIKFLKFPKKAIVKPSPKPPLFAAPDLGKQFSSISRRGSFLSRGEKLLSKLAELTNLSTDNPIGNVRGQRNMVFAVVSPPKQESKEMCLKRKSACDLSMNTSKKLKFSPTSSNRKGSLFEKLKMVD